MSRHVVDEIAPLSHPCCDVLLNITPTTSLRADWCVRSTSIVVGGSHRMRSGIRRNDCSRTDTS